MELYSKQPPVELSLATLGNLNCITELPSQIPHP